MQSLLSTLPYLTLPIPPPSCPPVFLVLYVLSIYPSFHLMLFNVKSRRYTNMVTTATSIIIYSSAAVRAGTRYGTGTEKSSYTDGAAVCMHALTEWSSNKCVQVVVADSGAERLRVESVDILH